MTLNFSYALCVLGHWKRTFWKLLPSPRLDWQEQRFLETMLQTTTFISFLFTELISESALKLDRDLFFKKKPQLPKISAYVWTRPYARWNLDALYKLRLSLYSISPLPDGLSSRQGHWVSPSPPLLLVLKPTERGWFPLPDTELALLRFQPLSIQEGCPSGSMSMSVIPDMLCSDALHDSLPSDLLVFLNATHLCSGDLSSVV